MTTMRVPSWGPCFPPLDRAVESLPTTKAEPRVRLAQRDTFNAAQQPRASEPMCQCGEECGCVRCFCGP